MKRTLIAMAVVGLFVTGSAFAQSQVCGLGGCSQVGAGANSPHTQTNTANPTNTFVPTNVNTQTQGITAPLTNTQSQAQSQSNQQGQQQGQSLNNRNSSRSESESESYAKAKNANAQDVSFSQNYEATHIPNNTPSIALPNIYPTSPCMGSTSLGGSGPGLSLGFGTSWKDDDCGKRETARAFAGLQMKNDAVAVLCSSSYADAAPVCKELAKKKAEAEKPVPVAVQGERTPADRKTDALKDTRTAAVIQQPRNCVADQYIAARTGAPVCK